MYNKICVFCHGRFETTNPKQRLCKRCDEEIKLGICTEAS
jgi:hypothetical protein